MTFDNTVQLNETSINDLSFLDSVDRGSINTPYYLSWAKDFVFTLKQAVQAYEPESPSKVLLRYLKINILDENNKLINLSRTTHHEDIEVAFLPNEPLAFNEDKSVTVCFNSPIRVSGITSGDTLTIGPGFPQYRVIIDAINDFKRITELLADVYLTYGNYQNLAQEMVDRALAHAETHFEDPEPVKLFIEQFTTTPKDRDILIHYASTPESIAYLAYARMIAQERHRMRLEELYTSNGIYSENVMHVFIKSELKYNQQSTDSLEDIISERIYDRYEKVLTFQLDIAFRS